MANFYSNLWTQAPFRGQVSFIPQQAQNVNTRAQDFATLFTFSIPAGVVLATNDIIHLIPATPAGFRVTRWCFLGPGYDGGAALTMNLGYLSQANGTGVLTGLPVAGIRTGGAANVITLTDAQLLAASAAVGPQAATLNLLPAGANDELIMFVSAGAASAGTNGISTMILEGIVP